MVEFTVEAGRPDTITFEKLQVLKEEGITRISINPQTMNQDTLNHIGRKHTVEEVVKGFELARSAGHDNINMDLIMGLPGRNIRTGKENIRLGGETGTRKFNCTFFSGKACCKTKYAIG